MSELLSCFCGNCLKINHSVLGREVSAVKNSRFFSVFSFATKEPNGLLLYNGRFNEKHDFIAMEIINEQIQLTFSAGKTLTCSFIYSTVKKKA